MRPLAGACRADDWLRCLELSAVAAAEVAARIAVVAGAWRNVNIAKAGEWLL